MTGTISSDMSHIDLSYKRWIPGTNGGEESMTNQTIVRAGSN
jgi:hypothetical protein